MNQAWDEAFLRVESYLHAHHLESRVLLNQLASDIIREARERVNGNLSLEPVATAMAITHERIGTWLTAAGILGDWSEEKVRARGRLALVLADLPGRWANYFLSPGPLPAPLVSALTSGVLRPGPELRLSNMAPAPLEFGFEETGQARSREGKAAAVFRAAAGWLAIIGLYGAAWAAAH